MCRLIVVLSLAVAFGLATPAFAEPATLDAIVFSSVPVAEMGPPMEMYFVLGQGDEKFDAKWCALLIKNATKPVNSEK